MHTYHTVSVMNTMSVLPSDAVTMVCLFLRGARHTVQLKSMTVATFIQYLSCRVQLDNANRDQCAVHSYTTWSMCSRLAWAAWRHRNGLCACQPPADLHGHWKHARACADRARLPLFTPSDCARLQLHTDQQHAVARSCWLAMCEAVEMTKKHELTGHDAACASGVGGTCIPQCLRRCV